MLCNYSYWLVWPVQSAKVWNIVIVCLKTGFILNATCLSSRNQISNQNILWCSDTIWCHITWSTLVQVMACCLTAPSHYLNQCWLIISEVLRHSSEGNFTENAKDVCSWYEFENQLKQYYSSQPIREHVFMVQWYGSSLVTKSLKITRVVMMPTLLSLGVLKVIITTSNCTTKVNKLASWHNMTSRNLVSIGSGNWLNILVGLSSGPN